MTIDGDKIQNGGLKPELALACLQYSVDTNVCG